MPGGLMLGFAMHLVVYIIVLVSNQEPNLESLVSLTLVQLPGTVFRLICTIH